MNVKTIDDDGYKREEERFGRACVASPLLFFDERK
jgi:hypothetical protein